MPYKGDRTGCSKLLVVFRSQVTYARKVQVLVDLSIQVELGKQLLLVLLSARAAEGAKWAIVVICSNACLQVGGSGAGVCYGRSHGQSRGMKCAQFSCCTLQAIRDCTTEARYALHGHFIAVVKPVVALRDLIVDDA
eukprot:1161335-Pelagomonas_calceolata.AAC.2